MKNGIMDDQDLAAYAAEWDMESAAREIKLDRTAQTYEAGQLLPVDNEPMVPLKAFAAVALICLALILVVLL